MPYSTLLDLEKQLSKDQLIALTDDENLGIVDQPTVDKAIADADADIDVYLSERYPVPLSPVPGVINRLSVDIAIYYLYSRRLKTPEERRERHKSAIKLLMAISDGKATLGIAAPPPVQSGGVFSSEGRKFSRTKMDDF